MTYSAITARVMKDAWLRSYRQDALTAQKGRCAYCKSRLSPLAVTADHIRAKSRGGRDTKENILAACYDCNRAKGRTKINTFKKSIKHPPQDAPWAIYHAWIRRKLSIRIERAEKRILRYVGLDAEQARDEAA